MTPLVSDASHTSSSISKILYMYYNSVSMDPCHIRMCYKADGDKIVNVT